SGDASLATACPDKVSTTMVTISRPVSNRENKSLRKTPESCRNTCDRKPCGSPYIFVEAWACMADCNQKSSFHSASFVYVLHMNLLPFGNLPVVKPRQFVPESIDLGDWSQISPLYDRLEARAPECATAADLERWLIDWSELNAALDEDASK